MNPTDELMTHVLEVIKATLDLKSNMSQLDSAMMPTEMARLRNMINGNGNIRGIPAYLGEGGAFSKSNAAPRGTPQTVFLGARYALACWADEIIVDDPHCVWRERWKENMLEVELFGGTSQRRWRFWAQAELAENQVGHDSLEVYFWCVMLGFREGSSNASPADWLRRVKRRITESRRKELSLPTDLGVKTSVPPLNGPAAIKYAGRVLFLVAAITLFLVAVLFAQYLASS
jgi:type VI secretion system protein ImpK